MKPRVTKTLPNPHLIWLISESIIHSTVPQTKSTVVAKGEAFIETGLGKTSLVGKEGSGEFPEATRSDQNRVLSQWGCELGGGAKGGRGACGGLGESRGRWGRMVRKAGAPQPQGR